jgi:hypothetical protein
VSQALATRDVAVVRVLHPRSVEGRALKQGEIMELPTLLAERLVRSGDAEPAAMPPPEEARMLDVRCRVPIGARFGVKAIAEWRCWLMLPDKPAKFTLQRTLHVDGETWPLPITFNLTPENCRRYANGDRVIFTSEICRVLPTLDYQPRQVGIT